MFVDVSDAFLFVPSSSERFLKVLRRSYVFRLVQKPLLKVLKCFSDILGHSEAIT